MPIVADLVEFRVRNSFTIWAKEFCGIVEGDPRACLLIPGDTLIFRRSEETLRIPRFSAIGHYNVGLITDCLEAGLIEQVPEAEPPPAPEDLDAITPVRFDQYRVLTEHSISAFRVNPGDTFLYSPDLEEIRIQGATCSHFDPSTISMWVRTGRIELAVQGIYYRSPGAAAAAAAESDNSSLRALRDHGQQPEEDLIEYWVLIPSVIGNWTLPTGSSFVYDPTAQKAHCKFGICALTHSELCHLIEGGNLTTQGLPPPTKIREAGLDITIQKGPAPSFVDIPKLLADPVILDKLKTFKAAQGRLTIQLAQIEKDLTAFDNEIKMAFPGTLVDPTLMLATDPLRSAILDVLASRVLKLRNRRADLRKQVDDLNSETQAFFTTKILGDLPPHEDSFLLDL